MRANCLFATTLRPTIHFPRWQHSQRTRSPQTCASSATSLVAGFATPSRQGCAPPAPVVVVMMADLSDDFPKVLPMVSRTEAGAAVVCGSRYMRGGQQIGGPLLKRILSRGAGLSLYWLAGLPTHDATNSFKAYRRDFLEATPIESTAGFSLGLELTVKAHFQGRRVEEIPAVWQDRSAGQSRFRLWKWLPLYLRWYFWALRQRACQIVFRLGRFFKIGANTSATACQSQQNP